MPYLTTRGRRSKRADVLLQLPTGQPGELIIALMEKCCCRIINSRWVLCGFESTVPFFLRAVQRPHYIRLRAVLFWVPTHAIWYSTRFWVRFTSGTACWLNLVHFCSALMAISVRDTTHMIERGSNSEKSDLFFLKLLFRENCNVCLIKFWSEVRGSILICFAKERNNAIRRDE